MGLLFIQAVQFADIPVMAAYLCLIALFFVVINLVVDLLYYAVDPRLRIDRAVAAALRNTMKNDALEMLRLFHAELIRIRRDIHAHPELGFEETRTSQLVADKLGEWGIEVHRGLAKTGVVGVIKGRKDDSGRAIGLRADMDCLPMNETNDCAAPLEGRRPHARLRPRRPHHHAARRRALSRADAELRRHGQPDLPAGGGRRRRRARHDRRGPVRALSGGSGLRPAQLARPAGRARWRCGPAR